MRLPFSPNLFIVPLCELIHIYFVGNGVCLVLAVAKKYKARVIFAQVRVKIAETSLRQLFIVIKLRAESVCCSKCLKKYKEE